MTKKYYIALILMCSFFSNSTFAQEAVSSTFKTYRVGIFAPLYLDSVFIEDEYKYAKNFPRFVLQGLDFVQGAQIAFDSMPGLIANIDARFFDSKSTKEDITSLIINKKLDSLDLMIGSVKDEDYRALAGFALEKKIPFVSATYPNDGGITENPYLVIVNSTLKAHCEAIYSYVLQNHGTDKVMFVRKPGTQEDKVAGYFSSLNKPDGKSLVNIQTVNIDSTFNIIKYKLDTTKQNIIIGGSLDEDFAYHLAAALAPLKKKYDITLIGMPNWDGFQSFNGTKKSVTDFPIYFTSPYFNPKWDNYSKVIQDVYLNKYKGKPSDYSYKGFETIYLFTRLFTRYPTDFMNHLNDYAYRVFSEYNFRPVSVNQESEGPDYFENKHLYFLKSLNGTVSKAW
ncbi:MAG: hypothetical protein ABIT58_02370 [Ferruginibacter sp.]